MKAYVPTKEQEAKRANLKNRIYSIHQMFQYYESFGYIRGANTARMAIEKDMVERIFFQLMLTQDKINKEFNK